VLLGEETIDGGCAAMSGAFRAGVRALLLWLLPVGALLLLTPGRVFADFPTFFSKLAVLTFGGAYAVARPGEMLDGLGMAETTPGPLIMVLQFVGFIGAFREAGWATPLLAGTLGGGCSRPGSPSCHALRGSSSVRRG
jgi:chromate transporter